MASDFEVPAGQLVVETVVSLDGIEKGLREIDRRGERAGAEAGKKFGGGFFSGFDENGIRQAVSELDEAGKKAEEAGERFASANERVDQMSESMETAGETSAGLAAILVGKLSRGLTRVTSHVVGLAEIGVDLLAQGMGNLGRQLQARSDEMEHFGALAEGTGRILEGTAHAVEKVARGLTQLRLIIGAGIILTLGKGAVEAGRFQESFAAIDNLVPQTGDALNTLRTQLSELSAETGVAAEIVNETYLKALQRMPRLAEDSEKALALVRTAVEAHSTGFTDAATAVEAYEAVLQGFNLEAESAEEISAKLFKTQSLAGVRFEEIASSVGDVASLTNALGGSFEDLLGIYATLVPTGQSVAEVTTQIRAAINGIISPTDDARAAAKKYGVELSAARVESVGFNQVLMEIIEAAEGRPEVIGEIFGRQEARNLLITLADRMEVLRERTRDVADDTETHSEIVDDMNERISRQKDLIAKEWVDAVRQLGFTLSDLFNEPVLGFLKLVRLLSQGLTGFFGVVTDGIRLLDSLGDAFFQVTKTEFWRRLLNGDAQGAARMVLRELEEWRNVIEDLNQAGREMQPGGRFGGVGAQEAFRERERREEAIAREMQRQVDRMIDERLGWQETVENARAALEEMRRDAPIPRPPMPTSPEFSRDLIADTRQLGEARAKAALIATGDEERYQELLHESALRVNRLVSAEMQRLRAAGIEEDKVALLASLYDEQAAQLERVRDAYRSLADLPEGVLSGLFAEGLDPDLHEQIADRMDEMVGRATGAEGSAVGESERLDTRIERVARALSDMTIEGRSAHEVLSAMTVVLSENGVTLEALAERYPELAAFIEEYRAAAEGAGEETSELTQQLSEALDQVLDIVRGSLQLAQAFGLIDEKGARLASSLAEIADGAEGLFDALNADELDVSALIGSGLQVAGGVANLIVGSFGEDRESRRIREQRADLVNQLEELNQNFGELAQQLRSVPGETIAAVSRAAAEFDLPEGDLGPFEGEGFRDIVMSQFEAFKAELEAAGFTLSDVERVAESLGLEVDDLTAAWKGNEVAIEALRDDAEALERATKEIEIDRLFEEFSGQMQMLRTEFELFDIEDPVEKLEKTRDLFLEFANLPPKYQKALEGVDLSTEEGRARFEQIIQEIFRAFQAGEITAPQLGDLSVDEFIQTVGRMEGLVDQAADAASEGKTESFQVFRGVTEITANRLEGTLISMSIIEEQQLAELVAIRQAVAGGGAPPVGTQLPPAPSAGSVSGSTTVHREGDSHRTNITVPVEIHGAELSDQDRIAEAISGKVARKINRELGRLRQSDRRKQGKV